MFDFYVGQRATLQRSFGAAEVAEFLAFIGSRGAVAVDGDDGATVPSGLIGGLISTLLGTALPGRGTNWLKQTLRFGRRAAVGETLTASVEIVRVRPDQQLVNLRVVCAGAGGECVCEGEALVMAREMA